MEKKRNLWVLQTDKPSRLYLTTHEYIFEEGYSLSTDECENKNIYITSDEEIKRIDYWLNIDNNTISNGEMFELANDAPSCKKIILTTDQDLIKDSVQHIDDEFLEWFVKNPSCEIVDLIKLRKEKGYEFLGYEIIIPKETPKTFKELFANTGIEPTTDETGNIQYNFKATMKEEPKQESFNSKRGLIEVQIKDPNTCEHYKEVGCIKDICDCYILVPKQETLEEADKKSFGEIWSTLTTEQSKYLKGYINRQVEDAKKWQQERSYSEEEADELVYNIMGEYAKRENIFFKGDLINNLFEQFKKK